MLALCHPLALVHVDIREDVHEDALFESRLKVTMREESRPIQIDLGPEHREMWRVVAGVERETLSQQTWRMLLEPQVVIEGHAEVDVIVPGKEASVSNGPDAGP